MLSVPPVPAGKSMLLASTALPPYTVKPAALRATAARAYPV